MKTSFKLLAAAATLSAFSLSAHADNDPALYTAMDNAQKTIIEASTPVLQRFPGILVGVDAELEGPRWKRRLEYTYEIVQYNQYRTVEVTINAGTGATMKIDYERIEDLPTQAQLQKMKRVEEILTNAEQTFGKYVVEMELDKQGWGPSAQWVYGVDIQQHYSTQKVIYDANTGQPHYAGGNNGGGSYPGSGGNGGGNGGNGGGGNDMCPPGTHWDWKDRECEGEYNDWEYENGQWTNEEDEDDDNDWDDDWDR